MGCGLIFGKPNNMFKPHGNTTRAEAEAIVQRFLEQIEK